MDATGRADRDYYRCALAEAAASEGETSAFFLLRAEAESLAEAEAHEYDEAHWDWLQALSVPPHCRRRLSRMRARHWRVARGRPWIDGYGIRRSRRRVVQAMRVFHEAGAAGRRWCWALVQGGVALEMMERDAWMMADDDVADDAVGWML